MSPTLPNLPRITAVPMIFGIGGLNPDDPFGGGGGAGDPFLPANPPGGGQVIWGNGGIPSPIPGVSIGGGGVSIGTGGPAGAAGNGTLSTLGNVAGFLANPFRWVLLIIGLIFIAGAIYLFKPTSELIAAPARAVRDATVASAA
jgi:hypothetical protein